MPTRPTKTCRQCRTRYTGWRCPKCHPRQKRATSARRVARPAAAVLSWPTGNGAYYLPAPRPCMTTDQVMQRYARRAGLGSARDFSEAEYLRHWPRAAAVARRWNRIFLAD